MAPYDVGAIAGIVVGCIAHPHCYSNVSYLLALNTFIFVLPGTETGRSRRRSGKGRRRAGQRSELIGCKQNQFNLVEGYMCRTIKCIPQIDFIGFQCRSSFVYSEMPFLEIYLVSADNCPYRSSFSLFFSESSWYSNRRAFVFCPHILWCCGSIAALNCLHTSKS